MTKEENKILRKLKKEEKYDEIFRQFGQKQFVKSVSRKYRKQDISKLKKEGKFEDIYLRYGKSQYNRLLDEAKQREIEEAYGKRSAKAIQNKITNKIKSVFGTLLIGTGMIGGTGTLAVGTAIIESEQLKNKERTQYEEVIKEYEEGISEYAENIKAMKLTDLETFMKLQADMHNSIKGYGTPTLDIFGFEGVDIAQENGIGVCRNMANDFMNKLNAINPEYNARCITVKLENGIGDTVNIQRNTITTQEGYKKRSKVNEIPIVKIMCNVMNYDGDKIDNTFGNHMVVAVDLKEENTTIIIDPTNNLLGVCLDGEIIILNSVGEKNPINMYRKPVGEVFFRGIESLEVPFEYIKSFLNPHTTIEELNEKYGVRAQQDALDSANEKELKYIYNSSKRNFRNSMKVNLKEREEKIYTIEEIEKLYHESMQKVSSITNKEEAIEMANTYRKITYEVSHSMEYYNKKQEEIIGRPVNEYAKIGDKLNFDISNDLRNQIVKKMMETDAINLPIIEGDSTKEVLCEAYLQTEPQKRLQDLKVIFDKRQSYYILDNEDNFLAKVQIGYIENTYTKYDSLNKDLEKLYLQEAQPIVKESKKDKEIDEK